MPCLNICFHCEVGGWRWGWGVATKPRCNNDVRPDGCGVDGWMGVRCVLLLQLLLLDDWISG